MKQVPDHMLESTTTTTKPTTAFNEHDLAAMILVHYKVILKLIHRLNL